MNRTGEPILEVRGLAKRFAGERVLEGVDLELSHGEILSILGRSGSGKTTLLKVIAGLEHADAGRVRLEGRDLGAVAPQRRGVLYLYQEALLFPHLDVTANLAFGLEIRRLEPPVIRQRVEEMLVELDLTEHAGKRPHQLSGGQRQRVSFGRALLVEPRVLLLDEPFGALDSGTRELMQELFRTVVARKRIPALFVTHDLKEAIRMGDRVAHLAAGRLRVFEDLAGLVADPELGLSREIEFWSTLAARVQPPDREE